MDKKNKLVKIGIMAFMPMVVGDCIIFSVIINFLKDNFKKQPFKIYLFINRDNIAICNLMYKKYIEEGSLVLIHHKILNGYKIKKIIDIKNYFRFVLKIRRLKLDYFFNFKFDSDSKDSNSKWRFFTKLLGFPSKNNFYHETFIAEEYTDGQFIYWHKHLKPLIWYKHMAVQFVEFLNHQFNTTIPLRTIELDYETFKPKVFKKPTIGFFIGTSDSRKTYHPHRWAEIFDYIKKKYKDKYQIICFGHGEMNDKLFDIFKESVAKLGYCDGLDYINMTSKNDLKTDMEYCASLDLAITQDSGFMHVASVFKIKTISIFGFSSSDTFMSQFGNDNNYYPSVSKLACSPCNDVGSCPYKVIYKGLTFTECLMIKRDDIFDKIDNILSKETIINNNVIS